jgi:hypothetical protein
MVMAAAMPATEVEIPAPPAGQKAHQGQRRQRRHQGRDAEMVGERHPDDPHRPEVVDDGQGEQEHPERRGQPRAGDGQGGHGEGDVGGDRDRPALRRAAADVEGQIDKRRDHHAAERRDDRQGEAARIGQLALQHFVLDLQADDEKEDRHQPFLHPVEHRVGLGEAADLDGEGRLEEPEIEPVAGRVGHQDADQRRRREHDAGGALGLQEIQRDALGHGPG